MTDPRQALPRTRAEFEHEGALLDRELARRTAARAHRTACALVELECRKLFAAELLNDPSLDALLKAVGAGERLPREQRGALDARIRAHLPAKKEP